MNSKTTNNRTALTRIIGYGRGGITNSVTACASLIIFSAFFHTTAFESAVPDAKARASTVSFVTAYDNLIDNVEYDLAPEAVDRTSDGGYIALALTGSPTGGASWLLKLDAAGEPAWQSDVGCNGAPGDYALGVSIQQSTDGGYILGGGVLGCGESFQRALVEKVDANGTPLWALAYAVSASTSINQIKQTTDGGYIAVGSAQNVDGLIAALVLKLDANGAVQWQRELGSGTTAAYFNAVLQTSDGGYAVLGESYVTGTPLPVTSVLLVAFGADGTVRWQQNYNNLDSADLSPTSSEHADSIIQTSEGGYLIGGNWGHGMGLGAYGGALLLKLT